MTSKDRKHAAEMLGHSLMLAFKGARAPASILQWLAQRNAAGVTLFRNHNVQSPAQVRALTESLQEAAATAGRPTLLIAADQEGGQLLGLGEETTPFPGNMALGAARDATLSRQVGRAMGREISALGVNVDYAPVCDVNTNPHNPNVGVRAFGDDAALVAGLGAAMIEGLQEAGVAATAKHFPGNGESALDPHHAIPLLSHELRRLQEVEFRPFRAAIAAGVRLVMSAHVAVPALTGRADVPATLRSEAMQDLLRKKMGFEGVLLSDAMDMKAITQGAGQIVEAIAALRAGIDALLLTPGADNAHGHLYQALRLALSRGLLDADQVRASAQRVLALKHWLGTRPQPGLDVVGCHEHRALAREVARRSLTLVRDEPGILPLQPAAGQRIAVVMPRPADLTPADTSSRVTPALAQAVRAYHPRTEEFIIDNPPGEQQVAALKEKIAGYDLLLLVTLSASMQSAQEALARELLSLNIPTVTIAARTPYDLQVYPQAPTYVCTYGIQPPSMEALAAALWGKIPFPGRLPVSIPGLYSFGRGITG